MKKETKEKKREEIITILKPFYPFDLDNHKNIKMAFQGLVGKFPEIVSYPIFLISLDNTKL